MTPAERVHGAPMIVPAEEIAARALSKAVKGKSLKGFLEKEYSRLKVPDAVKPVIVAIVSNVARRWMVLAKSLDYPYERPKASLRYWRELVVAYQALYRKVTPSRMSWAFKYFPKDKYLELLKMEPGEVLSDLPAEERERVSLSVPKWAWDEISKFTNPKDFVEALDNRKGFWVRIRDKGVLNELRRIYEVHEGPFDDTYFLVGPMREIMRRRLHPTKLVIMELASATIAHLSKGKVLDLTSAPGGKALHAWDLGHFTVANDLDVRRFAFRGFEIVRSDARLAPFRRAFDTIILDPDCTGLGRLHSPETRLWLPLVNRKRLVEYQEQLIRAALELLRPGSRFIYSTCTVTIDENEGHSHLMEDLNPVDVSIASKGLKEGWRRYFPNLHKTIGFTFAVYEG